MAKLSAAKLKSLKPGMHGDGDRLWFQVAGSRSWAFRYTFAGKARQMGLGPFPQITLAEARELAAKASKLLAQGIDPLESKKVAEAASISFQDAAERFIASHSHGWRNPKHAAQWASTLRAHAFPVIGNLPVSKIETRHVMEILQPIWAIRTETASRLRGRIESVLDAAKAQEWRSGENPARWRGHLNNLLPAPGKVRKVVHHPALPWQELPAFMRTLRDQSGMGVLALRFAILTAARSGEVRGATWAEMDLPNSTWTVPAERMKARHRHRVPLNEPAIAILREVELLSTGPEAVVFPGRKGQPLSDMSLSAALKRLGRADITPHGFRATFRDWCAEATAYPNEVAEMALAHTISNKVEAAYRRGDLLDRRRALMDAWAEFIGC